MFCETGSSIYDIFFSINENLVEMWLLNDYVMSGIALKDKFVDFYCKADVEIARYAYYKRSYYYLQTLWMLHSVMDVWAIFLNADQTVLIKRLLIVNDSECSVSRTSFFIDPSPRSVSWLLFDVGVIIVLGYDGPTLLTQRATYRMQKF